MRIIPKKTKVATEFFKGMSISDVLVGFVGVLILVCILISNLPYRLYLCLGLLVLFVFLLLRLDDEPLYKFLMHILRHCSYQKKYEKKSKIEAKLHTVKHISKNKRHQKLPDGVTEQINQTIASEVAKVFQVRVEEVEETSRKLYQKQVREQRVAAAIKRTENAARSLNQQENQTKNITINKEEDIQKNQNSIEKARQTESKNPPKNRKKKKKESKDKNKTSSKASSQIEPSAVKEMARLYKKEQKQKRSDIGDIIPFTDIYEDFIHYNGEYFGAVIELPPVEFRFYSEYRQDQLIDRCLAGVLRNLSMKYSANLVKIERPVIYDQYIAEEYRKIENLKEAFINGLFTEEELKRRIDVIYDRINYLDRICFENKVILPFFYLVLFDSDKGQLSAQVHTAIHLLESGDMKPKRLNDKEIAVFLKYSNGLDFDEREIDPLERKDYADYAMPEHLTIKNRTIEVNHVITHNLRVISYPTTIGNAWGAYAFDTPGTKVVMKMKPIDRSKAIRAIDRSIDELRSQENNTSKSSKLIELSTHIDTLSELLVMLQNDNESLMEVNIYITAYDIVGTMASRKILNKPEKSVIPIVSGIKKAVRRIYSEAGMKVRDMQFEQMGAWIGSQISGYDPNTSKGRDIHSGSAAAAFPFIYSYINDKGGINLGKNNGVPVFIDFFRRDHERVNSNMVIIGKSGSGKSFATKSLLSNLAAENGKIFVLDPENEYTDLAHNLGGKIINVGNATQGRLNPFHIITNLEDDETDTGTAEASTSFSTHLQFLEEFFRQILPDIESDAMEYLNNQIIRVYSQKGIDEFTDLSELNPEDYPIFDDLYDIILEEFQSTKSEYLRANLQILMNYIAKFSTGGRNAAMWNGESTISTDENFIVFNFQSLLANRNNMVANAQMLLVLKWLDNEIIKNRDYNVKYNSNRKIIVVIDEAHVFIDTKYPLALDFMFQLAKRIRKYNGMQIVITQNVKDFVGSEEIARKSTAIINACQYSLIFSLAPNDMNDLCTLYEKAGEINENEQEQIINAKRGQAFVITSPSSRSSITVETQDGIQHLFSSRDSTSTYFNGKEGQALWQTLIQDERIIRDDHMRASQEAEERRAEELRQQREQALRKRASRQVQIVEMEEEESSESLIEALPALENVIIPPETKFTASPTINIEEIQFTKDKQAAPPADTPEHSTSSHVALTAALEAVTEALRAVTMNQLQPVQEPAQPQPPVNLPIGSILTPETTLDIQPNGNLYESTEHCSSIISYSSTNKNAADTDEYINANVDSSIEQQINKDRQAPFSQLPIHTKQQQAAIQEQTENQETPKQIDHPNTHQDILLQQLQTGDLTDLISLIRAQVKQEVINELAQNQPASPLIPDPFNQTTSSQSSTTKDLFTLDISSQPTITDNLFDIAPSPQEASLLNSQFSTDFTQEFSTMDSNLDLDDIFSVLTEQSEQILKAKEEEEEQLKLLQEQQQEKDCPMIFEVTLDELMTLEYV